MTTAVALNNPSSRFSVAWGASEDPLEVLGSFLLADVFSDAFLLLSGFVDVILCK